IMVEVPLGDAALDGADVILPVLVGIAQRSFEVGTDGVILFEGLSRRSAFGVRGQIDLSSARVRSDCGGDTGRSADRRDEIQLSCDWQAPDEHTHRVRDDRAEAQYWVARRIPAARDRCVFD